MRALTLFRDTHLTKLELLSNATTIDQALQFIKSKQSPQSQSQQQPQEQQESEQEQDDNNDNSDVQVDNQYFSGCEKTVGIEGKNEGRIDLLCEFCTLRNSFESNLISYRFHAPSVSRKPHFDCT
jgi:hypothetical protein